MCKKNIRQNGREAWRTICLCGQQKENNISRIRSCLFRVWFVALSDSSSSPDYFSEKKQMLRALREFLTFRSEHLEEQRSCAQF